MSKQIDERVVEMRFDNKQFESGVKETMSTLDKFKQKLQLKDATKGLDDLEKSAKKVDINPLGKAAETVTAKFSALQVAGVTALANITNSAVNAGKNIAKAFTLDPILTGFQEYETQINSVQTILANTESKGSTLQDVNSALAELNTYADMTIYNFTEMTRNIGTFTAAGVDLKTSVSAIKGIANLAAVSGSTSLQASTAMYQLSQALASGTVKLMDWNSVVNAGMGGQVFQDALKETARVHNIAIDNMIKKEGSFRETLKNGWLTSEILTETLSKFTGDLSAEQLKQMGYTEQQIEQIIKMGKTANDAATKVKTFTQLFDTLKEAAQSGWTASWQTMIGDFEEAKNFLTDVSDRLSEIIGKSADARNEMISGGLSSGWKQLLNAGIADEEGYKETFKNIAKEQGTSIDDMIAAQKKLDESISDTEAFQKALKQGFSDGTISADMLTESVNKMAEKMGGMSAKEMEAAGYTAKHVEQIKALSDGLKDGSISMDEFVKKITRTSGRENLIQSLWNSFDGLMNIITPITEAFREIFPRTTGDQLYDITVKIENITAKFKELTEKNAPQLKSTFKGIFSVISVGVNIVKSIIGGITTLIGKLTGFSGGLLEISGAMGDWATKMANGINEANLFGKAIDGITGFLGGAIDKFKEFTGAIKEKVTSNGFEWFFNLMKSIWDVINKIGSAIGKVASALGGALADAFRNGDFKSLLDILNGGLFASILLGIKKYISGLTDKLDDAVGFVDKIKDVLGTVEDSLKSWQQNLQSGTIKNIAIAIGILAASLWVLSGIDSGRLASALTGIGVLMVELMGAMYLFTKISADAKSALKGIPSLIGIAAAVLILSSALKKIADISWGQLAVGLTGILGLMAILVGAAKILSTGDKKIQKGAMQMVVMAAALKILSSVCKDLSELSLEQLGKGVSGITAILLAFAGFQALMKKIQPEKMLSSALSLILIGVAMKLFANVCSEFGNMKWPDLGKAGVAMAGILVIAAGFGKLSSYSGKMMSSSVALVVIGAAMEIFADVANKFGQIKWQDLEKAGAAIGGILLLASGFALLSGLSKGMLASAAALLVMVVALRTLTPVLTTLGNMSVDQIVTSLITLASGLGILIGTAALIQYLGLIPGMLAMAGAVTLIGVACLAAGAGIMMFAAGFTALAAAGAAGATAIVAAINVIVIGILELIPSIVNVLTDAIVAICNVIIKSAPAIGEAIKELVLLVIDVLVECIPQLTEGLFKMVIGVLDALAKYTPQIVTKLFEILIGIIESASAALGSIDPEKFLVGITAMLGLMAAFNVMASLAAGAMVGVLAFGAVIVELAAVLAILGGLAQIPGLEWLISEGGDFLQKIGTAIGQFIGGIIGGIAEGATSILPQLGTNLSTFMTNLTPFIEGAKLLDESLLTNVKTLTSIILELTGAGILDAITSWFTGGSSIINFGSQLAAFGPYIKNFADSVDGINTEAVTAAANAGKMMAEMAKALPNSGGVAGFFAGNNDMDYFGSQLVTFGEGIADFSTVVDGKVSEGAVASAVNAGKMISELAASLPNSGGVAGFFYGNNDMDDFGEQLTKFGEGIASFSESISGKIDGVDSAVASIKKIISMFKSISGVNAESVATFKESLSNLGEISIKGFIKSFTDSDDNVKTTFTKFLNGVTNAINNKKESLKSDFAKAGKYLVDGFANGITDNTFKAEAKARAMALKALEAAKKALDEHSPSKKFMKVGAFVVAGFAKGISKNIGDANKASVKMANGVLQATQDELGIHSPSVVFDKKVGRYIVKGISEGIKKDMSAEEAAKKKAQNIVNAFKEEIDRIDLTISNREKDFEWWLLNDGKNASDAEKATEQYKLLNDNLWDYNQQVKLNTDKWIQLKNTFGENDAQTLEAYGIMRDSQIKADSVAKSMITLNESIVNASTNRSINTRNKEFELWKATEGKNSDDIEILTKQKKQTNDDLWDLKQETIAATDNWNQLKEKYGENNESTLDAYDAMIDAKTDEANKANELNDIDKQIIESQEDHLDNWRTINGNNLELMELYAENGYILSDAVKDNRYLEYYYDNIKTSTTIRDNKNKAYEDALAAANGDINNTKVQEAAEELQAADKQLQNDIKAKNDYKDSMVERAIQDIEDGNTRRGNMVERWEAKYGNSATDYQRYLFYKNIYDSDLDAANKEYSVYLKAYNDLVKQIADKNGISIEEAKQTEKASDYYKNYVDPAYTNAIKAQSTVNNHRKDYLEQQKKALKDSYETASDIADIKYQIWELTTGRDTTDADKDTMKLAFLTQQLNSQAKLVEMAKEAWKSASADEKLEKEQEYWNAQLQLAKLQSEVLDIQEANTKRQQSALDKQRLAQDEYEDYMNRYEKYYLDNGMTLDDLERDAKLVSGYDPDTVMNTAVSKVNNSIDTIKTNVSNLTKAVSEGIQNGVTEITITTSSMLDSCADVLSSEKDTWFKAGAEMADKLSEGIISKIEVAVEAVTYLVYSMIMAMAETLETGLESVTGITPVFDMSDITSNALDTASSLNSTNSLNLAKAIAQYDSANTAVTPDATQSSAPVYSFTQNNYSPKSLSAVEVYRQTNNLISRIGKRVTQ